MKIKPVNDVEATSPEVAKHVEKPTPWTSVYSCGICAIVQAAQFTIYFSSMWPYLLHLNPRATEAMYGWIVTAYSVAQLIAAPSFGYLSNRIDQVRIPILWGFSLMITGNVIYLLLDNLPVNLTMYGMMMARLITGAGTGNATLLRAYVGSASTKEDKFKAIACVTGGIALGTLLGPAAQLMFLPLGKEGFDLTLFRFNIFTGPAIVSLILNIIGFILMKFHFDESIPEFDTSYSEIDGVQVRPDAIALTICVFSRFSQIFIQTVFETINSPYSIMMFGFSKEDSVTYNSLSHAISGSFGAALYYFFIFKEFGKKLNERRTTVLVQFFYIVVFAITFSWPFLPDHVVPKLPGNDFGCDFNRFSWCEDLTAISSWVYYGSNIALFGIAFSFLNVALSTLFSNVIGPRKQGTFQGIFQMAGSIGRLLAPLITSNSYTLWGPHLVWMIGATEAFVTVAIWIIFYRRMIPFDDRVTKKKPKLNK